MLHGYWQITPQYFLQILFKSIEIWLFYHEMCSVPVFFLGHTVHTVPQKWDLHNLEYLVQL